MTQSEIEQKATDYNLVNSAPGEYYAAYCAYTAACNACILDSQNQIDKLVECLREYYTWDIGDLEGTTEEILKRRQAMVNNARTLLATFTDKNLEDD